MNSLANKRSANFLSTLGSVRLPWNGPFRARNGSSIIEISEETVRPGINPIQPNELDGDALHPQSQGFPRITHPSLVISTNFWNWFHAGNIKGISLNNFCIILD